MGRWLRFKGGAWWDVGLGLGEGLVGHRLRFRFSFRFRGGVEGTLV